MDNSTKLLTKQYLDIQNKCEQLQKQICEMREQRKKIETQLIRNIHSNGLQKHAITYQGRKVYLGRETCYDGLTFKFLETCLLKLFGDKDKTNKIIKFIKDQRGRIQSYCIRCS